MFWIITAMVLGIMAGIFVCRYGAVKTLKIEFEYSPLNWVLVVLIALASVLLAFLFDLTFSLWICNIIGAQDGFLHVLKKFLENGLLIPLLSAIVSYVFAKKIESLNMQYLRLYSVTVPKVCFSVLVVSFCLVVWFFIIPKDAEGDAQVEFLINRILMWLLTVLGTWVGFGFACGGSLEKDNKLISDNNKGVFGKEKLKFWIPIILALLLCDVFIFVSVTEIFGTVEILVAAFGFAFLTSGLISAYLIKRKINPSHRRSLKLFLKARNNLEKGIPALGQYGKVEYELFDKELKIKPRTVIYEGHQNDDDFKNLFAGPTIEFSDFNEALKKLKELNKAQRDYIQKGFDDCVEIEKQKKTEKIK